MTADMALFVLGFALGSVIALIVYILLSKKTALFESRASSADAVNSELRKQLDEVRQELDHAQNELKNEAELRAAGEARHHEAEKNLQAIEKDLLGKFNSISSTVMKESSEQFLQLAETKLKAQTVEGTKELENKKGLIDNALQTMDKTLSEVRKKIEDVNKGNVEVSTLIKKHEDITAKLKDTTDHLKQALASSKKRGEWGERMAEDIIHLVGMVEGVN
ncbi:MAG: DNA recombination protein RmuC, partial [Nitrospiraceae bacterium]